MLKKIPAKKIGMAQIFDQNRSVVPVTVVDCSHLYVTQVKTVAKDGYNAMQLGRLRKRYEQVPFSSAWLKKKARYFQSLSEVTFEGETSPLELGAPVSVEHFGLAENGIVSVSGISRGLGFQGVVKRHGFSGGPSSHGSMFHRAPGSIGNRATQGSVIKGKKLPGHAGRTGITISGLTVVRCDKDRNCLFVKGAVPGKKDSLLMISK